MDIAINISVSYKQVIATIFVRYNELSSNLLIEPVVIFVFAGNCSHLFSLCAAKYKEDSKIFVT